METFIGVLKLNVLAYYSNINILLRVPDGIDYCLPLGKVRFLCPNIQELGDLLVEAFPVEEDGAFIDYIHVFPGNDCILINITEKGDLIFQILG